LLVTHVLRSVLLHPACEARMRTRALRLVYKLNLSEEHLSSRPGRPLQMEEVARECLHGLSAKSEF